MRDHSFNRLQSIRIICSTTLNSVAAVIRQCAPCRIAQARLSACLSRLLLRPLVAWRRVHTRTAASRTDIKDNHGYILVPTFGQSPQTENRLKKLIRIWRALHEYVNCVHDPEKQYRSLSACWNPGVLRVSRTSVLCTTASLATPPLPPLLAIRE